MSPVGAVDFVVRQVADINPVGDSIPSMFTELNGELFFSAQGPSGQELYKTDGNTVALVADIYSFGDSSPADYVTYSNELYFAALGPSGRELYKTDGTNVALLADINPNGDSAPIPWVEYAGELYFRRRGARCWAGLVQNGRHECHAPGRCESRSGRLPA